MQRIKEIFKPRIENLLDFFQPAIYQTLLQNLKYSHFAYFHNNCIKEKDYQTIIQDH